MRWSYLMLILLSGCAQAYDVTERKDILAVFWHERNRFSVALAGDNDRVDLKRVPMLREGRYSGDWSVPIRLVIDAPSDDTMWYECSLRINMFEDADGECVIHLKSLDSLQTAGWDHGKFGSGTTSRIR